MDLPTCPSCKQSVLDEDATDCPFCGASMKGGASSPRAVAAPPAKLSPSRSSLPVKLSPAPSAPAAEAKAKPVAEKQSPPKRAEPADDDPFAVDESIGAKAIPLSPKPGPGKSLELKCPMCETTGYASPKVAGQQVRCCNPKCLVPIFSAPAPKKAEPPPPPPPPKKPVALYAGIGMLVLALAGVGVWLSGITSNAPKEFPPIEIPKTALSNSDDAVPVAEDPKKGRLKPEKLPPVNSDVALTTQALKKLQELNLSVPSNRKAFSRRLSAMAFIESGDLKGGRDQLEQLMKIGKQTPYEACLPNVLLAWRQMTASPDEFAKHVAEAKTLSESLPNRGRYAIEAGIGTAAALVAAGQADEARKVIAAHTGPPNLMQLAAAYQVVQNDQTYDLDATLIGRSLGDWLAPRESAVTLILAAHDRWDDAQTWAFETPHPVAKSETILVWAEAFARHALAADPADNLQRVRSVTENLPPAAKARLLARLAAVRLEMGNREAAEELLLQSTQLLEGVTAPAPFKLQSAKSILDLKLPDDGPLRMAALAAAEVGLVRTQMKQNDSAWVSFHMALRFLRGAAPGLTFADQKLAQVDGAGAAKIRGELQKDLQLKNADQVQRSFNQYKKKLKDDIRPAAFQRFLRQAEILEIAARAGFVDQVWDEVQKGEARPDVIEKEPFLTSSVPTVLVEQFKLAGKAEIQQAVAKAAQPREAALAPEFQARVIGELVRQELDAGNLKEVLQQLNQLKTSDTGVLHEVALRLGCRLVKSGKISEAVQFARDLKDTLLREDCLFIVAALAARHGHAAEVWKQIGLRLGQTETVAACTGLVTGLAHPATSK